MAPCLHDAFQDNSGIWLTVVLKFCAVAIPWKGVDSWAELSLLKVLTMTGRPSGQEPEIREATNTSEKGAQPEALKPQTLNPKPSTLNPKP